MEADSGNASIDVNQTGSHVFQTKVTLFSDVDLNVASGASLVFGNVLDLNGFDLNFTGSGTLRIDNIILSDSGGNINNLGGGALMVTDKNGDGITNLQELVLLLKYWL